MTKTKFSKGFTFSLSGREILIFLNSKNKLISVSNNNISLFYFRNQLNFRINTQGGLYPFKVKKYFKDGEKPFSVEKKKIGITNSNLNALDYKNVKLFNLNNFIGQDFFKSGIYSKLKVLGKLKPLTNYEIKKLTGENME